MSALFNLSQSITRFMGDCQSCNEGFWSFIDKALVWLWAVLGDVIVTCIFTIFKYVLNIVDLLQILIEKLVGLDYWGTSKVSASTLGESDIIFKFLFNDSVQRAFRWMCVVFVILVIVFTIIAIVKSEYETATTGDLKKSPKMPIITTMLKSVATVVLVPILLILGILLSNAILTSIVNALNVNNDLTLGSQIFSVSSYSSNRYRVFADENERYAASNRVSVKWTRIEEDGSTRDYSSQVETYLKVINPSDYGTFGNRFNGYYFELNGKPYLMEVSTNCKSPIYYPSYETAALNAGNPFYDIESGETAESPQAQYEFKADAYKAYLLSLGAEDIKLYKNVNLNELKSSSDLIKGAYNTWSFNKAYTKAYLMEDTIDLNTNNNFTSMNGTRHTGVSYPRNTEEWGKYNDGGTGGTINTTGSELRNVVCNAFVALRDEYYVMGDIIDFMCSENVKLSVVNSADSRILWNYYGGGSPIETYARVDDDGSYDFLVNYSLSGKMAYTPNPNAYSEDAGAIFIMCFRTATGSYVPLLHNVKYTNESGKEYTFLSDYYTSGYKGVVIARGLPYGAFGSNYGFPTIISNQVINSKEGVVTTGDATYYAKIESGAYNADTDKYYSTFYKIKDFSVEINTDWFTLKDGSYYLNKYNAMIGDATYAYNESTHLIDWTNGSVFGFEYAKNRIKYSLPKKFAVRNGNNLNAAEMGLDEFAIDYAVYHNGKTFTVYKYADLNGGSEDFRVFVDMDELKNGKFVFYINEIYSDGNNVITNSEIGNSVPIFAENNVPDGFTGKYVLSSTFESEFNTNTYEKLDEGVAHANYKAFADGSLSHMSTEMKFKDTDSASHGVSLKIPTVYRDFRKNLNTYVSGNTPAQKDERSGILKYCTIEQYSSDPDITLKNEVGESVTEDEKGFVLTFTSVNNTLAINSPAKFCLTFDKSGKLLRVESYDVFNVVMFGIKSDGTLNTADIRDYGVAYTADNFKNVGSYGDYKIYSTEVSTATGPQAFYSNVKVENDIKTGVNIVTYNVSGNASASIINGWLAETDAVPFYDSMIPIRVTYEDAFKFDITEDGIVKGKYSYDPELKIYYTATGIYVCNSNNFIEFNTANIDHFKNTPFYEQWKSMDAVKQAEFEASIKSKFQATDVVDYLISADQLDLRSGKIKWLKTEVDGANTYDVYSVEFLMYNGKLVDITDIIADAHYVGRVYTNIKFKRTDADKKVEFSADTHVNNIIIKDLIGNSYSYILDGKDFDKVPSYDINNVNIKQIYDGFGTQIFFKYYESTLSLIVADVNILGIFNGTWRWEWGWGVEEKPVFNLSEIMYSLKNGEMGINYNMPTGDPGTNQVLTFQSVYVPHKFNFIVFVFATIVIFGLIFTSVWGLITRIYEITMYFIIMPGVAAVTPLDGGGMFKNWKTNIVKKILGAYGVMIGLNLFFLLIPPIKEASQIFTAADFDKLYLNWIPGEFKAKYINLIIYLMFLLVALSMIKTLPGLIAKMLNAENVYDTGKSTREAVKSTIKEVGDTVSGKKAVDKFHETFGELKKGKDGKLHREGGLLNPKTFIPGSAVIGAYKDRRAMKQQEAQDRLNERKEQVKAFAAAAADEQQEGLDAKLAAGFKAVEQAGNGGTDADTNKQNDLATQEATDVAQDVAQDTAQEAAQETAEANANAENESAEAKLDAFQKEQEDQRLIDALNKGGTFDRGFVGLSFLKGDAEWEKLQQNVAANMVEGMDADGSYGEYSKKFNLADSAAKQAAKDMKAAKESGDDEAYNEAKARFDKYDEERKDWGEKRSAMADAINARNSYANEKWNQYKFDKLMGDTTTEEAYAGKYVNTESNTSQTDTNAQDIASKMEANNQRLVSINTELDNVDKASYTDERDREEDRANLLMERDKIQAEQKQLQEQESQAKQSAEQEATAQPTAPTAAAAATGAATAATAATAAAAGTNNAEAQKAVEEAKFYADIAKGYAEVSKQRADIEAGKLPEVTDEQLGIDSGKRTRHQKALDKANEQQQKDQANLEKGKQVKLSGAENKSAAHEQTNKKALESGDITKIVINETTKNSKTMKAIMAKQGVKTVAELEKKIKAELYKKRTGEDLGSINANSAEGKVKLQNAEKLYTAQQKANVKRAESEYAVGLHAEKAGKLQATVAREKEKVQERAEKKRIKEEAWNAKSGFGKFITRTGQVAGVLTGVGIPIMLGVKAGKAIKDHSIKANATKYIDAKANKEAFDSASATLGNKNLSAQQKLDEIRTNNPQLYAKVRDDYENNASKNKGWNWNTSNSSTDKNKAKASADEKLKRVEAYLKENASKAQAELDKAEKKITVNAKASKVVRKFVKPVDKAEKADSKAQAKIEKREQKAEAKQKKQAEILDNGNAVQKWLLERKLNLQNKMMQKQIKFAKFSQRAETKQAIASELKMSGASGVVSQKYNSSRIKHRENFINQKLRREDIAAVAKSVKLGEVQSSYKTRVSGVVQGLGTVNNSAIKDMIKSAGLTGEIHKMSMTELKKSVDKLKASAQTTMKELNQKMENNTATATERATYKALDKTIKDLDSKADKMVTKAAKKRAGATSDEVKGNVAVAPKSAHDRAGRGKEIEKHYQLSESDLKKVADASKKYMKEMNAMETKHGASKTKNAGDAFANSKALERIIETKIQTSKNAKDIEELRQDLVKVRKAYKDMSKDIKKINSDLSPISAAVHAQNAYKNIKPSASASSDSKPKPKA